jgi:hypothetical protein
MFGSSIHDFNQFFDLGMFSKQVNIPSKPPKSSQKKERKIINLNFPFSSAGGIKMPSTRNIDSPNNETPNLLPNRGQTSSVWGTTFQEVIRKSLLRAVPRPKNQATPNLCENCTEKQTTTFGNSITMIAPTRESTSSVFFGSLLGVQKPGFGTYGHTSLKPGERDDPKGNNGGHCSGCNQGNLLTVGNLENFKPSRFRNSSRVVTRSSFLGGEGMDGGRDIGGPFGDQTGDDEEESEGKGKGKGLGLKSLVTFKSLDSRLGT